MGKPTGKQKGISFGYCDIDSGQRVYPAPLDIPIKNTVPTAPGLIREVYQAQEGKMYASIRCFPPIGQATTIGKDHKDVHFSVLLETSAASHVDDIDTKVIIWHNFEFHHEWSELLLNPSKDLDDVLLLHTNDQTVRRWYTGTLSGRPQDQNRVVSFTVKFQMGDSGWKWATDVPGVDNGTLHYLTSPDDLSFDSLFPDASSKLKVKQERADTPDTRLYCLTSSIAAATGKDSGYTEHSLGIPKDFSRWFALVRLWSPWLAPRQGKTKFEVDKDAILAAFLRNDGKHVVCLAVSGLDDVLTVFKSDSKGNVIVQGRNDRTKEGTSHVVVAVADSFELANAAVMYHARTIMAGYESATDTQRIQAITTETEEVKPQWLEEWYDGFTYCTWNGLGQDLNETKINNALQSLQSNGIKISNLIIDDNWQSLSEGGSQFKRGWTDFDANKQGFPRGLKAAVTDIRKAHPNIKHIAVWHAILGYWGGVAKDGNIGKKYKTRDVEKEQGVAEGVFTIVDKDDVQRMYYDFYEFLSSAGIDAVKTDAQFFLDMLVDAPDRRDLINEYQDAWTIAHLRHFQSRAISCMSQTPQILFHSQLPTNKPRVLVRNSDDFFPEVPSSHPWHIFCNAHNSLLTQHSNVLPDWDMFQTSHPWASFHAAARCISGGPIYFTDEPGKHDINLINAMTATTPRGNTVILRPGNVGKSVNAYTAYDEQALLKVGTYTGYARTGTGFLGLFNCSDQALGELVSLNDFPGTEEGKYIVRAFSSGAVSKPMARGDRNALVGVNIPTQGWEILAAHPVRKLALKTGTMGIAFLGLLGKMTGAAAMTGQDAYVEESGRLRIWLSFKALGTVGIWLQEKRDVEKDMLVLIKGKPVPRGCVGWDEVCGQVLRIDLEKAWREMGGDAGWSNEASMELFIL